MGSSDRDDHPSWWRLGPGGWKAVLKATARQFKDDLVANLAAVVTLRLVLALVPSLIAAVAITTLFLTPADIEALVAQSEGLIPTDSRQFVTDVLGRAVQNESGAVASIVGVLVGLFAATSAAAALIQALNTAYDAEEGRGFVGQRLVALMIVGALFVALAGMFISLVVGPSLVDLLLPQAITDSPVSILITVGRYLGAVIILILFFEFVFRVAPNSERPPLGLPTPGAVAGVVGWMLLSYLFSLYVRIAGNYDAYGAAAGIVILLIWLNYSFTVLLMGAELDHEIEKHLMVRDPKGMHDAIAGEDPDDVDPDMPRHTGLVGARVVSTAAPIQRTGRAPLPPPRLSGVAARTVGASLASRLWGRIGR